MIAVNYDASTDSYRLIIRGNQSMTWRQNVVFLYATFALAAIIAAICTYFGFWLVLPFTGLEMLLLTGALYVVARRASVCEVVTIDERQIVVEVGRRAAESRSALSRHWAKVTLREPRHPWYHSSLAICSHGRCIEVGRILREEERRKLAEVLEQILQRAVNHHEIVGFLCV